MKTYFPLNIPIRRASTKSFDVSGWYPNKAKTNAKNSLFRGDIYPKTLRVCNNYTQWAKSPKKTVCRSVFLATWHCILSAEMTKNALLQTIFWGFFPTGQICGKNNE